MTYDFDEIIDRTNTNSENVDGWRPYIFKCGPEKNSHLRYFKGFNNCYILL